MNLHIYLATAAAVADPQKIRRPANVYIYSHAWRNGIILFFFINETEFDCIFIFPIDLETKIVSSCLVLNQPVNFILNQIRFDLTKRRILFNFGHRPKEYLRRRFYAHIYPLITLRKLYLLFLPILNQMDFNPFGSKLMGKL